MEQKNTNSLDHEKQSIILRLKERLLFFYQFQVLVHTRKEKKEFIFYRDFLLAVNEHCCNAIQKRNEVVMTQIQKDLGKEVLKKY